MTRKAEECEQEIYKCRPSWPRQGDTVTILPAGAAYTVVETFYANGDKGMHISDVSGHISWASAERCEVVRRAGES